MSVYEIRYVYGYSYSLCGELYAYKKETLIEWLKEKENFQEDNEIICHAGCPSTNSAKWARVYYLHITPNPQKKNEWKVGDQCWAPTLDKFYYMANVVQATEKQIVVAFVDFWTEGVYRPEQLFGRDFDAFALYVRPGGKSTIVPLYERNFSNYVLLEADCKKFDYSFAVPLLPYQVRSHSINHQLQVNLYVFDLSPGSNGILSYEVTTKIKLNGAINQENVNMLHYLLNGVDGDNAYLETEPLFLDDIVTELTHVDEVDQDVRKLPFSTHIESFSTLFDSIDEFECIADSVVKKSEVFRSVTKSGYDKLVTPSAEHDTKLGRFRTKSICYYLKPPMYIGINHCIICQNLKLENFADHITLDCDFLGRCSNCRCTTHNKRDCPYGDAVCFWCNRVGHRKAECPNGKRCYHCDNKGHETSECPQWKLTPVQAKLTERYEHNVPPHKFTAEERRQQLQLKLERVQLYDSNGWYNPFVIGSGKR